MSPSMCTQLFASSGDYYPCPFRNIFYFDRKILNVISKDISLLLSPRNLHKSPVFCSQMTADNGNKNRFTHFSFRWSERFHFFSSSNCACELITSIHFYWREVKSNKNLKQKRVERKAFFSLVQKIVEFRSRIGGKRMQQRVLFWEKIYCFYNTVQTIMNWFESSAKKFHINIYRSSQQF